MRKYSIDFVKFVGMLVIILHHFQHSLGTRVIHKGYLMVELFFIISGFFIYKNYKEKDVSAIEFTINKIKKLYPIYFIGLVLSSLSLKFDFTNFIKFLYEAFLLQGLGLTAHLGSTINYPCWYISVLIWGGYLIYFSLKKDERLLTNLISPIIILLTYSYLRTSLDEFGYYGPLYIPLIRGISGMLLGVLIAKFVKTKFFASFKSFLFNKKWFFYFIELFTYALIALLIMFNTSVETFCVILFSFVLMYSELDFSLLNIIFNKKCFANISKLSYAMFVLHAPIIMFFNCFILKEPMNIVYKCIVTLALYFVTFALSLIAIKIVNYLQKKVSYNH